MLKDAATREPWPLLVGAIILLLGPVSLVLNPLPPEIVGAYGLVGVIVGLLLATREPALACTSVATSFAFILRRHGHLLCQSYCVGEVGFRRWLRTEIDLAH